MIESSKKGDGTKIINSIISEAKKQGISKITLSTTEGSGWGFFNKLGFDDCYGAQRRSLGTGTFYPGRPGRFPNRRGPTFRSFR